MLSVLQSKSIIGQIDDVRPVRWLVIAGCFHIAITVGLLLVGHFGFFPNQIKEQGTLAADSLMYNQLAGEMAETLKRGELKNWIHIQAPIHARLYSLAFVFPGTLLGYNILSAEPLNLAYYLGIICCVYLLGKQVFDRKTGWLSAAVVAVWPSFLLHSTQLIRDSLAILCLIALVLILITLISKQISWRRSLLTTIGSLVLSIIFWLTRGNMWSVMLIALAIATILLAIHMVTEKRLYLPNLAVLVAFFAAVLIVPTRIESTTVLGHRPPTALITISSYQPASRSFWSRLLMQINSRRAGFRHYSGTGSNIDGDITFKTGGEVVRYLPRAAEIGLFAPFPRSWLEEGSLGRTARLLAGGETLVFYLLYIPTIFCAWRQRRSLSMWLIFMFALASLITLGLVVVNVGALYRVRYAFWILVVVLGVAGINQAAKERGIT